jgi:hypothetical protein
MTEEGKIVHISNLYCREVHDMNIRKQGPPLHPDDTTYVDSGYQGMQQDHANTKYPYKSPKNKKLKPYEKEYNRALSRVRVKVEHKIRQLKVFKILKEQYRNRRKGFGGNWFLKWRERRNEKQSLAAALRGEIKAYLDIVKRRGYLDIAHIYLANFKAGKDGPMPKVQDKDLKPGEILQSMYPIFYTHMKNVEILDEDAAEQLALFYSYCKAIHIDLIKFASGEWDGIPLGYKIKIIEEDLKIWKEAQAIGEKLIDDLSRITAIQRWCVWRK